MTKLIQEKYKFIIAIFIITLTIYLSSNNNKAQVNNVIGGDFQLINQEGQYRELKDFKGKYNLVFFGFTNCEMVCPTALNNLSLSYNELTSKQQNKLNVIFITVDPKRDKVARLKEYLKNFSAPIIGLTGSKKAINNVADKYKIYIENVKIAENKFTINQTSFIYLLNQEGQFIDHFAHNVDIDMLSEKLNDIL